MRRRFFWSVFFTVLYCRSTNLLRLFSGNLPAMLINFIGVNFEAGNETGEKIWSCFVAEQNEEWSEKSGYLLISLFSREREFEV